jgi:hypothetical protein
LGFLVPLCWLGPMMVVWGATDRTLMWPSVVGEIVAAGIIFPLGTWLNRQGIRHTFCGIRFQYWAFIFPTIVLLIYGAGELLS